MSQGLSPEQLLAQQLQQLQTLEKLIETEKQVLQQHDPEALLSISQDKNQQLLAIEALDKQISLDQQFAKDKAAGLLEDKLNEITNLLAHCQQQNLVNGQIIQQSQLAVERMKTSLLENHTKNTITYDNKGKKSGGLSSIGIKA
ncbi:flagellar export chaperone FlgN [Litorilituus lipolyticus]|uniref:Flagellar protein FlgN n=1 Tax=Litorilituus lipolyticus TaxID=2491017 RepID=A0A502KZI4_9GAMM|nr:flagellar export chaperone FlgN [Litorilituus lipolyticus]TPH17120.1 flagellar protein FlgN [Litorilituus lipolyticus]